VSISEIGERGLIEKIMNQFSVMPGMPVPFWDDISAVSLGDGRAVILKTDMLVWMTDVPKGMTYEQAARKCVIMNFSDLACKGVQPQAFLAAIGLPKVTTVDTVEEICKGFEKGVREYDAYMIGGDTNEACDIILSGMAYGLVDERRILKRGGARPGDILCTTGFFGETSAAFKILLDDFEASRGLRDLLLKSVYIPRAKVKEGMVLSKSGAVTSCIDSSDGLAISLHDLCRSSNIGFKLNNIPVSENAEKFATKHELDPKKLALYGGEEYELVFTVKLSMIQEAKKALSEVGCKLLEIGVVQKEKRITYVEDTVEKPVKLFGWDHFQSN
jgi:thiamine-monophosphate kinase